MAFTAEQKRKRRAEHKAARAAEDASRGVKRQPPGGVPQGRRWDEHAHAYVLKEQAPRPVPSTVRADDVLAWASAHPPPRRADFASEELWDEAREQWYALLTGKLLPAYGEDDTRMLAWHAALARYERASHAYDRREAHEKEELERRTAEREAERVRQAEQDEADAPLIAKLIDCEKRNCVRYHALCKQWHHLKVPCDEAHLYPMASTSWETREIYRKNMTGTIHFEGSGALRCEGPESHGACGSISRDCKCLPESHARFWEHRAGQHVTGSYVIFR